MAHVPLVPIGGARPSFLPDADYAANLEEMRPREETLAERGRELAMQVGSNLGLPGVCTALARAYAANDDLAAASETLEQGRGAMPFFVSMRPIALGVEAIVLAGEGERAEARTRADEAIALARRIQQPVNEILAQHSGQSVEAMAEATDRDRFLSADEALEFGLVDEVVTTLRKKSDSEEVAP